MKTWRFLDTGALPGSMNMALDEAILALHVKGQSPPTMRLYQWDPPALSLGHFHRRHGFDLDACRQRGFDVVQRPSGGKAVLHQGDLTYAIVASVEDGIPATVRDAYALICQGLLNAFRLMGVHAEIGRERQSANKSDLCFLRDSAGAVVCENRKFVGSAQTWRGSSMLQHGSILLEPQTDALLEIQGGHFDKSRAHDALKAQLTSLREILGYVPAHEAVSAVIRKGMEQSLNIKFVEGRLTSDELKMARQIAGQEYPTKEREVDYDETSSIGNWLPKVQAADRQR